MCLQLFQLTCKCGHLHLRRKRKGEMEGGRKRGERRGAAASASTKPGPRAVGVTLLLVTRQAHIQNQKSYRGIKDLFSLTPTEKKKRRGLFHHLFSRADCLSPLGLLFTALQGCPMSRFSLQPLPFILTF